MRKSWHIWGLSMTLAIFLPDVTLAQSNNCSGAIQVCNNQLAEQLDDGVGTQECPSGGCGCMLAGEKNTRWFKITIQTAGTLEFTIRPYNGTADYDFAIWNRGPAGTCPTGATLGTPDRCNFAAPKSPTGIRGSGNGNSNGASGNLYSNSMTVAAGDVIYLLIDNYDGTTEGFYLDFFGGAPGSGTGTTATFSCANVNQCSSCADADCKTWRFDTPGDYSFDETAANGGCHSNFAYASVQTATVCGTFTVPAPYTTVEFPKDRGYEITATNGSSTTTCLNSAVISYQVWGTCGAPLTPNPANSGIYTGLNNSTTYKVCKTVTVSGANCYLSRICLPYWTFPVSNDNMCAAIPLTMNAAPIAGTNSTATTSFDAGCTSYKEVWYSFVAPASGRAQVNVDPDAASDVKINLVGAMAGLDGGVNDCNLNCSTFDEDNTIMGCVDDYGANGTEKLFTFLIPGQTYYVWVSGTWARPNANFTIQVTDVITADANYTPGPQIVGAPDPIPANDQCANAIDLNPMCASKPGTTIGATAECTDPDPEYVAAVTLENDVWFKWTAPANNGNAQVTLEVTGVSCTAGEDGSLGIQFGIFRGSCGSLTPVSSGTTTLTFTPIAGATYYFVIDGNAGAQCTFNIGVKRPTITSQSCTTGSFCAGSPLSASFNYTYNGSNPGYRWAYCKSPTFGTACTIDLNNPATYSIYTGGGLPNPGCTPATYTFVGYLLADNGATTIAPGYPRPQPVSANCVNQTNACTFNIYPNIQNMVTVNRTNCAQTVTANAACSPAAPITITGNTNQTYAAGTSGTFTPVTVTWNAPYGALAPPVCGSYTINGSYACPGPSGSTSCPGPTLIVGAPATATNNNVSYQSSEDMDDFWDWTCANNYGVGVWFNFVAPNSGNADITISSVSSLDAVVFLFNSRDALDLNIDCDNYLAGEYDNYHPDICASCASMNNICKMGDQMIGCADNGGNGGNEVINARGLNPGETYYVFVDGYEFGDVTGNFSIRVTDPGPSITRPPNDNICGAFDLTTICAPSFGNNLNATSLCSVDPAFPSGYSTENSVWYTYTPTVSGPVTINYTNAIGTHCAFPGLQPGVQFTTFTSSDGTCTGTLTNVAAGSVYTGVTSGTVTINMTAGVKYFILVDGYAGNECAYEFQIYNGATCCTANLGQTEGPSDIKLCFGDQVTFGVTADPINFGANAGSNPVIGWQYSSTQPTVVNPFNPANGGKPYYVGQIDWTAAGTPITRYYEDTEGNYPYSSLDNNGASTYYNVTMAGFPAGATFNPATDTITLCVSAGMNYFADLDLDLVAPDGSVYRIVHDQCGSDYGWMNVCFSNFGTAGNITAACPGGNEVTGIYLPMDAWAGLSGEGINGVWRLRVEDDAGLDVTYFNGFTLQIRKPVVTTGPPTVGTHHGDYTIINNDPFKFGSQVFWLTPVTFANYASGTLYPDSCYHYGTPVKVTMLERVTTPNFTPTCAAPGDGSNGVTLTVTSPTGGWPGLVPVPSPAQYFTVSGSGAASGITFPSPPVGESETSNAFSVANGTAWEVTFTDGNGCTNKIGGTYDRPQIGDLLLDSAECDGLTVPFSVTQQPKPFARYRITLDFDSYPQDVYWFLEDGSGNVVASGGGYASTTGGATITTGNLDPDKGPYKFILYDAGGDGFGSGGGTTTGGSNTTNYIKLEELYADGTSATLFNEIYAFCTPVYCVGPPASVFGNKTVVLGTPTGTYVSGASALAYAGPVCGGAPITLAVTFNPNGTGTFNTAAAGINPGNTYSIKYNYMDQFGCAVSVCKPIDIFPTLTLSPLVNCGVNPPTIAAGASCTGCNATYVAEYSFDGGNTWTTSTSSTYNDIYVYGRIRNVLTGRVGCDVSSFKLDNCPPVILPVELVWIRAKAVDNSYIQVSWQTATEVNSAYFDVERSLDGVHFSYAGRVTASGNSNSPRTYYFNDRDVSPNVRYYYRVRNVDLDASFTYTPIVSAILDGMKDLSIISVYPNPTYDFTVISLNARNEMPAALTLYNELGQVMLQQDHTLQKGVNEWRIDTSPFAAGTYYLKVLYSTNEETQRLIILE